MNWDCWYFYLFLRKLQLMSVEFRRLLKYEPEKLCSNPRAQLYKRVITAISQAQKDPTDQIYKLGNSLGKTHRDWRRIKNGLPERYRLFFKFFSNNKDIFFTWLNDERSLRKEGAKTDCYTVFKRMLDSGLIPSDYEKLLANSSSLDSIKKL